MAYDDKAPWPISTVLWLLSLVQPPKKTDPPEKQHNWKIRITRTVQGIMIVLILIILVFYSLVPGVDGFVRKSDISKVNTTISQMDARTQAALAAVAAVGVQNANGIYELRQRSLSTDLFNLRIEISKDHSGPDRERDCKQFQNLKQLYQNLTHQPYDPEPCNTL